MTNYGYGEFPKWTDKIEQEAMIVIGMGFDVQVTDEGLAFLPVEKIHNLIECRRYLVSALCELRLLKVKT